MSAEIQDKVKEYYGHDLKTNDDLKTSACCPLDAPLLAVRDLLKNVHDAVQAKFYGCGSPLPPVAHGCTVLDLGCGTGRDAYVLSQLVGESGRVIGVDMTEEQLAVAHQYVGWHMEKFGYKAPNVDFHHGYIEDLQTTGIADESVDIVISNCVINLSADKDAVFKEIFRVLKPGGELYFSDVFAGRRIPAALQKDKVLLGECLGGALYIEDFRRLMQSVGMADVRVTSKRALTLDDPAVQEKIGMIDFYSMTMRGFKVDLEDICENYGHVAYYKGTIPECPHSFDLDDHHVFKTGLPVPVCGNTANMLSQTRYAPHFRVDGDFSIHYGVFDCGSDVPSSDSGSSGACC